MKSALFLIIATLLFVSQNIRASEVNDKLGNAVYAVREARICHADTISPTHYRSAVELLQKAQDQFALDNETEAIRLAEEAEQEAKIAFNACFKQ